MTKLSDYLGAFRAVVFTPDHLHLVKGAPENRRRFLDMAICQSFPRYVSSLSEYSRLLAQKNALLRGGAATTSCSASTTSGWPPAARSSPSTAANTCAGWRSRPLPFTAK